MATFPTPEDVALQASLYPREMLVSNAFAVVQQRDLSTLDLVWLLAGFEAMKPRVVNAMMSDGVNIREAVG